MDDLIYKGIVNLKIINSKTKLIKRSKTIFNNGTDALFFFLCKCLAQQYDKQYSPLAIDAYSNSFTIRDGDLDNKNVSALSYRILLSSQGTMKDYQHTITLDDDTIITYKYAYIARFSALIPFSAIIGTGESKYLKALGLHSSSSSADVVDSLLAYINIPDEKGIEIKQGESLLIEWNMGFRNP